MSNSMKVTMTSLVFLLLFATVVVKANRDSPCNSSNNNERVRTNNDSVQLVAVSSMNESNKRAGSAVDVSRSTSVNDQDLPLALTYRKLSARSYLSLCQQFSHLLPYILESLSKSLLLLDGKLIAVSAKKVRPDSDNAGNDGSMPLKNSYVWWELPLRKNIFNVHFMQIEQNHVVSLNHKLLGIEYAFRSEGSGKGAPLKPTYRGRDVEITDQESFSVTLKKIKVGTVTAPEIVAQKDTLIVLTTCNHLDTTIFALQYLRDTRDYADLLIVDDYSVDGTTEYLTKKGYAVLTKGHARGLTDSWNRGYELACKMGYKYIIYTNNDVLVSDWTVRGLTNILREEVLAVPMSTSRGAGHNPTQDIIAVHNLSVPNFADYVHNFRNFYRIQRSLLRHQAKIMGIDDSYNMEQLLDSSPKIDSIYLSKPIFNGFLFGVNLTGIEKAARRVGINLFHKMDLIAGQEDRLTKYIKRNGLPCPKIATAVFSYHFKSVTVAVAQKVHRSTPGFIEVREFLGLYHPELNDTRTQESSRIGSFGLVRGGPKLKFKGQVMSPLNLPLVIVPEAMENNTNSKLIHFPALYSNYNSLKLPSDLYVYAGDSYHQSTLRKEIVRIGVALTSLADIPSTDRIFHTFCQQYMATVKYLVPKADGKGVGAWYDPLALSELDVLIVTTHKYDLRKALQGSTFSVLKNDKRIKQPNTFMIAVAWIMESSEFAVTQTVGSWLGLDWIGNYDMLLGSSRSIVSFYTRISATIGFQVSCFMECPIARYVGKANKVTDENAGMEYRFFGRRTKLPVHLLTTSSEGSKLADVLRMNSVVKLYGREDPLEDVNGAKDTKRRQQSNEFNDDSESSSSFCVIVRTNEREVKKLWYSVHSLVKQFVEYRESNNGSEVSLKLMLLDTDNNSGVFSKKLRSVAAILNQETHRDMVFVVSDAVNPISKEPYPMSTASNPLHGYDLVDNLLDELAVEPDLRKSQGRSYNKTDINSLQCSYVTISTGTISYPLNYVSKILKELAKNYADALDIQSVHIFESSKAEKTSNEDVSVLAKYIVRLNLLQQEELYLLDKTIFTRDLSQIETRFEQRLLALFDKAIHNIQRENKRFVEVSKRETSNKYRKKKMIL